MEELKVAISKEQRTFRKTKTQRNKITFDIMLTERSDKKKESMSRVFIQNQKRENPGMLLLNYQEFPKDFVDP